MMTQLSFSDLTLETERLRLTPFQAEDLDIAIRVLCDADVMHFVTEEPETEAAVIAHMEDAVKRGAGGRIGIWCIHRKDTGNKIGDALLMPVPIEEDDYDWSMVVPHAYPVAEIEVGYLLVPGAWGQGFATEACARLLRFAFEETDLPKVVATTDPENARSHHVLDKCGLRFIGKKRAYAFDDVCWFEITREEWKGK